MTNLFRDIRVRCAAAGTNLTAVCRVAGVHRSVPQRWKQKEPRTRRVVDKIYAAIDRIASEHVVSNKP